MCKKYQVFISSTYKDLMEERVAVSQCLLEMNCIPVGMEQFPASNMSQMEYIEMMLNDCDYYILILAGKYGSLDSDGMGFTEKEYDYAVSHNIPILSFVVRDIGKLENSKCENDEHMQKYLDKFRKKVCKDKLVKFYSTVDELKANVAISLSQCIQQIPAAGWIRGNPSENINDFGRENKQQLVNDAVSICTKGLMKATDKLLTTQRKPRVIQNKNLYSDLNDDW